VTVVRIPPTLRAESEGEARVEAAGETVGELLNDLTARFPALKERIFNDGDVAPFVNLYLEGEDVRTLDGLETRVRENSTLILLPAMAGGCAVPLPVMLPSFWVASTKPEAAIARRQCLTA
jgi:molybdopterin synthase sulfur carrier subunit